MYSKLIDMGGYSMLTMVIVLLVLITYYGTFKLCKCAGTDNQELKDIYFLATSSGDIVSKVSEKSKRFEL